MIFKCTLIGIPALVLLCACHNGNNSNTPPPSPGEVQIVVKPGSGSVLPGNTLQFQATVTNASSQLVAWSVLESGGGSITSTGLYTAPDSGGPYHVVAKSLNDVRKSAQATVTLLPPSGITVSLDLRKVQLGTGMQQTFQATLAQDTSHKGVSWKVFESGGGTVDATGVYTAPATPGTYHVQATSLADTTKSDEAEIQVLPASTPATDIILQVSEPDESQWRLVSVPYYSIYGLDVRALPGQLALEIHAPKGTTGRGYAVSMSVDTDNLENAPAIVYLSYISTPGTDWKAMFAYPKDGASSCGAFAMGSGMLTYQDPATYALTQVDEVPLPEMPGVLMIQLKQGVTLMVGQQLTFTISKAGVLTKDGVVTSSTAIQRACVRGVVR